MSKQITKPAKRPYRKRRRAAAEDETRRRITEATVELHGSVGPAKTTFSAVAERAGVQRATVYRHFPDEEALFGACSTHWLAQHPLPDVDAWTEVADPDQRLRLGLTELYAWFASGEEMLARTTRDVSLVPALRPSMEALGAWFGVATEALMRGRRERGARRRRIEAAIGHAIAFPSWRSLVRDQGLSEAEAVELMAALVDTAR